VKDRGEESWDVDVEIPPVVVVVTFILMLMLMVGKVPPPGAMSGGERAWIEGDTAPEWEYDEDPDPGGD